VLLHQPIDPGFSLVYGIAPTRCDEPVFRIKREHIQFYFGSLDCIEMGYKASTGVTAIVLQSVQDLLLKLALQITRDE